MTTPPVSVSSSPERSTAKQDSFKKKLKRLRHFFNICDICQEENSLVEAAHIVDHKHKEKLEAEYLINPNLPLSVNDSENGLLLCPNCHGFFDMKEPEIRIKGNGEIGLYGGCLEGNYKSLKGKKVKWSKKIGQKNFPTKDLLNFALKLKPGSNKRIRELIEDSEEIEDEKPINRKKTRNKK